MIAVTIRHEGDNRREFGYGVYVNAYVEWEDSPLDILYASECVFYGENSPENIKKAERRVRAKARRIARQEYAG